MTNQPLSLHELNPSDPPPDIAIFIASLVGGGAERVCLNLARDFVSRGLRVDFIVAKYVGELKELVDPKIRFINLGASRVIFSLPSYLKYLHQVRPPHILASVENSSIIAAAGRLLSQTPHRLTIRVEGSVVALWHEISFWPWLACMGVFYRFADAFIAVSKGLAEEVRRIPGLKKKEIIPIYNGIIGREFYQREQDHPITIPGLFEDGVPIVVSVGRLAYQKDFPTLIHAFALARRTQLCKLLILGEGPLRTTLQNLINRLGLTKDVVMPGFIMNPLPILKRANLFALSSAWEGLSSVLIEALAVGLPVISTDCPYGSREILNNGRFGTLVPVGDAKGLAHAIIQSLNKLHVPKGDELKSHLNQFRSEVSTNRHIEVLSLTQGSKLT
jgi:glycosyltransferase involved in cell wall biosynthesis